MYVCKTNTHIYTELRHHDKSGEICEWYTATHIKRAPHVYIYIYYTYIEPLFYLQVNGMWIKNTRKMSRILRTNMMVVVLVNYGNEYCTGLPRFPVLVFVFISPRSISSVGNLNCQSPAVAFGTM